MFTSNSRDCARQTPAATIESNTAPAVAKDFVFMGVSFFISISAPDCPAKTGCRELRHFGALPEIHQCTGNELWANSK
jgi:hypothetical protein